MSYGNLIVDDGGLPIPQAVDMDAQTVVPLWSKNQALRIVDINYPNNGIHKMQIIGGDGNPVSATQAGIAVVLADASVNVLEYNGTRWVEGGRAKNLIAIPMAQYTSLETASIDIWNGGASNAFLVVTITAGSTKITSIDLQMKIGTTYHSYKVFTVDCGVGTTIISIGKDAADTFKCVLPSEFRIVCRPANSAALTYQLGVQLI